METPHKEKLRRFLMRKVEDTASCHEFTSYFHAGFFVHHPSSSYLQN